MLKLMEISSRPPRVLIPLVRKKIFLRKFNRYEAEIWNYFLTHVSPHLVIFSSNSEMVGFPPLVDLTRNDPYISRILARKTRF